MRDPFVAARGLSKFFRGAAVAHSSISFFFLFFHYVT